MEQMSLNALLLDHMRLLYHAQVQVSNLYPRLLQWVESPELQEALKSHWDVADVQTTRLAKVFVGLSEQPTGRICTAVQALLAECDRWVGLRPHTPCGIWDAGLIALLQQLVHYLGTTYRTALAESRILGETQASQALEETLSENTRFLATLAYLAETNWHRVESEPRGVA